MIPDLSELIGAQITGVGFHNGSICHLHIQLKNRERHIVEPACGRELRIWDYEPPDPQDQRTYDY